MIARTSRVHRSPALGMAVSPAAVVPRRALIALACLALALVLHQGLAGDGRPVGSLVRLHAASRAGLSSLPLVERGPVSAALGRDEAAYRIDGFVARNAAQHFSAGFGRSGVAITARSGRFAIALEAFGRGSALQPVASVSPVASGNRVSYARGSLREWWANGPLGLEEGFDIARRPAGSGALTLALAVPASARLDQGAVSLPGGLRYAGVEARDADGHRLRAWLEVRRGHVLVRVADRHARYPVRIDPSIQQAELTASDGAGCNGDCGDQFGYSVAIAGNTVVVGAPFHAVGAHVQQGAVYVFQMPAGGWAGMTQTAELTDSAAADHVELGYSVAISSDGDTIVAGAPAGSEVPGNGTNTQGSADVFTTTADSWTSTSTPAARLSYAGAESPLGGEFGWSVAVSGTTIVVGAPYDGSMSGNYPGLAYVYAMPGGGWQTTSTPNAKLTASDEGDGDLFGWSIAASGNTIVVGAPQHGVGAQGNAGGVYVFVTAGAWTSMHQTAELIASDNTGSDYLGYSVGVAGGTVVAGAPFHSVGADPQQGAVYEYTQPAGGWATASNPAAQTAELTSPGSGNEQGRSVAIDPSGATIVAGATIATPCVSPSPADTGAAYAYALPVGGWTNTAAANVLAAGDAVGPDELGHSVGVAGTTIVVGADRYASNSSTLDRGAVYVFTNGGTATTNCGLSSGGGTTPTPTPTTPTPTPTVSTPVDRVGAISGGIAKLTARLSCPAGATACATTSLKATVTEHVEVTKTVKGRKKVHTATKKIVVASGSASLAAGASKTLTLKLDAAGFALVKKLGTLRAVVTVSSGGKTIDTASVTVQKAAKPKKKK
jgi:FG-GAP repeat